MACDSCAVTFTIREEGGKYCVYSKDGKKLGTHDTLAEAKAQLAAVEAHKHMDEDDIEIFATGTWGGMDWSEDDLDQMVTNFQTLHPKGIKPPVKLGHDDNQILGQKDGQPALGWISALRRRGSKLIATLSDVPAIVKDLIDKRRYARVSSEIYPTFEATGAEKNLKSGVRGRVLSAVALLGADIPEVKTLEDLGRVLNAEGLSCADGSCADGARAFVVDAAGDVGAPAVPFTLRDIADAVVAELETRLSNPSHPRNSTPTGEDAMPDTDKNKDAAADAQAKMSEELAALRAEFAEMKSASDAEVKRLADEKKAMTEEIKRLRDESEVAKGIALKTEAEAWVKARSQKDNFRLFQSQQPIAVLLYQRLTNDSPVVKCAEMAELKISEPGDLTARELFRRFVDATPNLALRLEEKAHSGDTERAPTLESVIAETAKRENLNLSDNEQRTRVLNLVAKSHPELANHPTKYRRSA